MQIKMKPATIAKRRLQRLASRRIRRADTLRRMEEAAKRRGPDSVFADMLIEMKGIAMQLPEYLFVSSCDGALYDTREGLGAPVPNWSTRPLRPCYRRTFPDIKTVAEFKATLRAGAYAWPGGYPMFFVTSDGESLSFEGARENCRNIFAAIAEEIDNGWRVVGCGINWEDSDLLCAETGKHIESAYAD